MAKLEVLDGPKKNHVYEIDRDEAVVGRLPYCDVVINKKNISRNHARIIRTVDGYSIEDMNSTNGTYVNGHRIAGRTKLNDGDRLKFYDVTMVFRASTNGTPRDEDSVDQAPSGEATERPKEFTPGYKKKLIDDESSSRNVGVNAYAKLRLILEMNKALGGALSMDEVLPKLLDGLFEIFPQADRGFILTPNEANGMLEVKADKQKGEGTMISSSLGPIPQNVASRVMVNGEALLSADGFDDDAFDISDSVLDFPIRSMMCAPLIGPMQKPQGIIYIDTNEPDARFTQDDLDVMISVSATAGQALAFAQSHQAQLKLDLRERELTMAHEVQQHFLPQKRPDVPAFKFFDFYRSAQEVGGDYYGYVTLPDSRVAVTVGDVAGKGISAALIMAKLSSEVRYRLVTEPTFERAVEQMNVELSRPEVNSWFVTFLLMVLDPKKEEVTLINAGHMPPVLRTKDGKVQHVFIDEGGPPLGCMADLNYTAATIPFKAGDSLLIYTDGINEAMNQQRELYSMDRISEAVEAGPHELTALCEYLLADVERFAEGYPQSDDICLVGIQRVDDADSASATESTDDADSASSAESTGEDDSASSAESTGEDDRAAEDE